MSTSLKGKYCKTFLLKLFYSTETVFKISRIILFLLMAVLALDSLRAACDSLAEDQAFRKDFLQEYLLAVAVSKGEDPYRPISELEKEYLDVSGEQDVFPHPSPHPPSLIPYILWLVNLDYQTASAVWLVGSVLLTILSIYLVWRCLSDEMPTVQQGLFFICFLLASQAFRADLILGQLNSILVFLLTILLICEKKGNDLGVGLALGFCLSLKLFGLAFLGFYLFKKRLKVVVTSLSILLLSITIFAIFTSSNSVYQYFVEVAPTLSELYQADSFNLSPMTLPQRIFEGAYPVVRFDSFRTQPLFFYPELVDPLKYFLAFSLLSIAICRAFYEPHLVDQAFYLLLGSLAILPNLWVHSFLVLLPIFLQIFTNERILQTRFVLLLLLVFFGNPGLDIPFEEPVNFWYSIVIWMPSYIVIYSIILKGRPSLSSSS